MLFLFMLLVSVVGCFVEWVEEFCVIYMQNGLEFVDKVMEMVSWRGLGEVLGALGAPLGPQGGPKSEF